MRTDIERSRNEFLRTPALCLGGLAAIHLIVDAGKPAGFRLLLTIAYFGAVLTFLWSMTYPLDRFQQAWYAWRFRDAGPSVEGLYKKYLYSSGLLRHAAVWLLMLQVAAVALKTLARWPELSLLTRFSDLFRVASWVSWGGLVAIPVLGGSLIGETVNRFLELRERVTVDPPPPPPALAQTSDKPVALAASAYSFHAGEVEWSWNDLFANCIVVGEPGAGKTACVLNSMLDGLIGSSASVPERPSGLILDPKGDFRSKIERLCARYGRAEDLVVLEVADGGSPTRWNPFDSDESALDLANRCAAVMRLMGSKSADDHFFVESAQTFIQHAVTLVRLTNTPGVPPTLHEVARLVRSVREISERAACISDDDPRGDHALAYFADEWSAMAGDQRSGVMGFLTMFLNPFLDDRYAGITSGPSTVTASDVVAGGKILYVHMPIAEHGAMAKTLSTLIKLAFYREVRKRLRKTRRSFFLSDEFQAFYTEGHGTGDAEFFATSRESRHLNLVATQNLPALWMTTPNRPAVDNLLANCVTKILLRNSDPETNEWGSRLFGERLVDVDGTSRSGRGVRGASSQSSHAQQMRVVPPDQFTKLAAPDSFRGTDYCEALVSRGTARKPDERLRFRWKVHPLDS